MCQKLSFNTYMQIRVLDTPNHNDKYSNMFVMVKKHEIDTKHLYIIWFKGYSQNH